MIFIEGYSCDPGLIAYRAVHRETGVSVEKRAKPSVHAPKDFQVNMAKLVSELAPKIDDFYIVTARRK